MKPLKTKVVHSKTNPSWNIVNIELGGKYKIARVPYPASQDADLLDELREEAHKHALFISKCLNNIDNIEKIVFGK